MWRVHEIAPSATSTQLDVHALPADAPARRGGNLSKSCTQFPLETVVQLLKVAGVELPTDASANASDKPSDAAAPDVYNLDLVNMPATFDYEGDETSWQQGLPPGEVGLQLGEFELSGSADDSSAASVLGVCLDLELTLTAPISLAHTWVEQSKPAPQQGALPPPSVWPQGVLFYKSESAESDRHSDYNISMGCLSFNFLTELIGTYLISLSI